MDERRDEGILETVVGYSGSQDPKGKPNPTYRNIKDYAESIRVAFDPSKLSYQDMLDMFFGLHTPSDPRWAGTQYRSAIFVHTPEQRKQAEAAVQARGAIGKFVAVEDASDFYRAEEYHQKYIEKATSGY
jgi:methionine-S-sulfoxide reductase